MEGRRGMGAEAQRSRGAEGGRRAWLPDCKTELLPGTQCRSTAGTVVYIVGDRLERPVAWPGAIYIHT